MSGTETTQPGAPGTVTVEIDERDLPGGADVLIEEPITERPRPTRAADADPDDDDEDAEGEAEASGGDDAARERRRARRARRREARDRDRGLIAGMMARIEGLQATVADLSGRTTSSQLAMLGADTQAARNQLAQAQRAHSQAVERADGPAATQAAQAMAQLSGRVAYLENLSRTIQERASQPQENLPADPRVVNHADAWLQRNKWYNPARTDADSRHAAVVDAALAEEGFDPSTKEYWSLLDQRLRKVLPHRYQNGAGGETDAEAGRSRRDTPPVYLAGAGRERAPTAGGSVASQSATPTRTTTFRLSPERVAAAQESGIWDDKARMKKFVMECMATDRRLADEARR